MVTMKARPIWATVVTQSATIRNMMKPTTAAAVTNLSRNVGHSQATRRRLYHRSTAAMMGDGDDDDDVDRISAPRAAKAVELLPTYLADARAVEQYSPSTPNGALQLSVAENQMLEDLLVPSLTEFSAGAFPVDAIYYQPTQGREPLRKAMARYLEDVLKLSRRMDEDGIVVGAGCNAVLENLCIALAEPGEGVMIPTPYYAAFEFDLVARAGLSISPVTTMEYQDFDREGNTIPPEAYYPNKASLDAAVGASLSNGIAPRILLLSHPQNPLGICYPPEVIDEIIDWCRENKIHLISDEIYAGSVYREEEDANFVSALELASSSGDDDADGALGLGPYIHLVYALSKDFALSGLRVGALYSENREIRLPLQKLNDLCCISSHTQLLVEKMLTATAASSSSSDDDDGGPNAPSSSSWTERFRSQSHERLRKRGDAWHDTLEELGIPYLKGTAGLFIWMDFQEFLPPNKDDDGSSSYDDDERERKLYLELLKEFGLLFTPGRSMKNERPGFFRCVFTAASDEEFDLGMDRLRAFVRAKRGPGWVPGKG